MACLVVGTTKVMTRTTVSRTIAFFVCRKKSLSARKNSPRWEIFFSPLSRCLSLERHPNCYVNGISLAPVVQPTRSTYYLRLLLLFSKSGERSRTSVYNNSLFRGCCWISSPPCHRHHPHRRRGARRMPGIIVSWETEVDFPRLSWIDTNVLLLLVVIQTPQPQLLPPIAIIHLLIVVQAAVFLRRRLYPISPLISFHLHTLAISIKSMLMV